MVRIFLKKWSDYQNKLKYISFFLSIHKICLKSLCSLGLWESIERLACTTPSCGRMSYVRKSETGCRRNCASLGSHSCSGLRCSGASSANWTICCVNLDWIPEVLAGFQISAKPGVYQAEIIYNNPVMLFCHLVISKLIFSYHNNKEGWVLISVY